jgi:Zn-dependent protease with chaperone function
MWLRHEDSSAIKVSFATVVAAFGLMVAMWKMIRAKPLVPVGEPVGRGEAPQLWQLIGELAVEAQTRAPEEVWLVPDVNAAVSEDAKLMGLIGGRRRLYLGVGLLQGLTVAQLRSVLAHELGHYSGRHTSLAVLAYRGRLAVGATVGQLGTHTVVGWLLEKYGRLYVLVEQAVSRRQELEADEASVRVGGRATAQGALREVAAISAMWDCYTGPFLEPGWSAGYAPAPFVGGFAEYLRAQGDDLARLRQQMPERRGSKWDSHPPVSQRIAAMERMPDRAVPVDGRGAWELLPTFGQLADRLDTNVLDLTGRRRVSWDEFAAGAFAAVHRPLAEKIFRAAALLVRTRSADLATVFEIVASGRLPELARQLTDDAGADEHAAREFAGAMQVLLCGAAVRSGVAEWRHSWSGSALLLGRDGEELDMAVVAGLACVPETLSAAQARLAALGIDVSRPAAADEATTARRTDVMGGIANVKIDGVVHDVLIMGDGLILIPCPKTTDGGRQRMAALVSSAPGPELAARHRFLSFETITTAVIKTAAPVHARLTLKTGATVTIQESWTSNMLTSDSRDLLHQALTPLVADRVAVR